VPHPRGLYPSARGLANRVCSASDVLPTSAPDSGFPASTWHPLLCEVNKMSNLFLFLVTIAVFLGALLLCNALASVFIRED
jgi:hypothetical protein